MISQKNSQIYAQHILDLRWIKRRNQVWKEDRNTYVQKFPHNEWRNVVIKKTSCFEISFKVVHWREIYGILIVIYPYIFT